MEMVQAYSTLTLRSLGLVSHFGCVCVEVIRLESLGRLRLILSLLRSLRDADAMRTLAVPVRKRPLYPLRVEV